MGYAQSSVVLVVTMYVGWPCFGEWDSPWAISPERFQWLCRLINELQNMLSM